MKDITIKDLLEDTRYKNIVSNKIGEILKARSKILASSPGTKYIRKIIDQMIEDNLLNEPFINNEIVLILSKQSKLPSKVRNFINDLCGSAFAEFNDKYLTKEESLKPKENEKV